MYREWEWWLGTAGRCATGNPMAKNPTASKRPYHFSATEDFWKKVDDWRRDQSDLPTRAESLRRLVIIGIDHDKKYPPKKLR
jgi:hypothetical protein